MIAASNHELNRHTPTQSRLCPAIRLLSTCAVGKPDQFVKDTFADETALVTRGAVTWQDPPELRLVNLVKVQGDGLFQVHHPEALGSLALPWRAARGHAEILIEIKMAGDHLDVPPIQRAVLRRQALWVQRVESLEPPWPREEPLWLVAPHVPEWLREERKLVRIGAGCYSVRPSWMPFVWIAANELPLRDELVPFLVARSGEALDEFGRWVASRRPFGWVLSMIESTRMSRAASDELLRRFGPVDDPEVEARRRRIVRVLLETMPDVREDLIARGVKKGLRKGREQGLQEARSMLRGVLAERRLPLTPDEDVQIERCADFDTLSRWMRQAVTAKTAARALR